MSHIIAVIIAAIIAATAATIVVVIIITGSVSGPRSTQPTSVAAPGPVAGVGLPAIALVSGYLWLMHRRNKRR